MTLINQISSDVNTVPEMGDAFSTALLKNTKISLERLLHLIVKLPTPLKLIL